MRNVFISCSRLGLKHIGNWRNRGNRKDTTELKNIGCDCEGEERHRQKKFKPLQETRPIFLLSKLVLHRYLLITTHLQIFGQFNISDHRTSDPNGFGI
jgi:hypothetical protein